MDGRVNACLADPVMDQVNHRIREMKIIKIYLAFGISMLLASCAQKYLINSATDTHTQESSRTLTPSITSRPTATATEILCITPGSGYKCIPSYEIPGIERAGSFAIDRNRDLWIVWRQETYSGNYQSSLLHISQNEVQQEIPLGFGVTDMLVTNSAIWLLNIVLRPDKPKLIEYDLNGNLVSEYSLPQIFFLDTNHQYQDYGVNALHYGSAGEIILSGTTGTWQFLDDKGAITPLWLDGLQCGQIICKIINPSQGEDMRQATITIGMKRIILTTSHDYIYLEILGVTPDGGLWVLSSEQSVTDGYTIYNFNNNGDVLGSAVVRSRNLYMDIRGDLYEMVILNGNAKVFRILPRQEDINQ